MARLNSSSANRTTYATSLAFEFFLLEAVDPFLSRKTKISTSNVAFLLLKEDIQVLHGSELAIFDIPWHSGSYLDLIL